MIRFVEWLTRTLTTLHFNDGFYDGDFCQCQDCRECEAASATCMHSVCSQGCQGCSTCQTIDIVGAPCCPPPSTWYFGVGGFLQSRETAFDTRVQSTFFDFSTGFGVTGAIGREFSHCRMEVEAGFVSNGLDNVGLLVPAQNVDSSIGSVSHRIYMANLYHDFHCNWYCWRPYIGAGIGFYQSDVNSVQPNFFAANTPPINATSNISIAYQFKTGLRRPIGERSEWQVGYRYFRGEEVEFASAPVGRMRLDRASLHSAEFTWQVKF